MEKLKRKMEQEFINAPESHTESAQEPTQDKIDNTS